MCKRTQTPTTLSYFVLDHCCNFGNAVIRSDIQVRCDQVAGAGLPQILFSLLREARSDDPEPLLVQVTGQQASKSRIAACDVHILVGLVWDPGQLPDPAVQIEENQQPQDVQEHGCTAGAQK